MDVSAEIALARVATQARLAEGLEGVRSVLLNMFRFSELNNKGIARKTGIAVPAVSAVQGELEKAGIVEHRRNLGEIGTEWVRKNLGLRYDYDPLPGVIEDYVENPPDSLIDVDVLRSYLDRRPEPDFALDQSHAEYKTVVRRVLYLLKNGDLEGRRILHLGDDDAISLCIAMTGLADSCSVIDIDTSVLEYLEKSSGELGKTKIEIIEHDLRETVPDGVQNQYDVVVTDPPYTKEGVRLFLKRAGEALRSTIVVDDVQTPVIGKRCILSCGRKMPEEQQSIQSSIIDYGFVISEMIPRFNRYKGAMILGQFSDLYSLRLFRPMNKEFDFAEYSAPLYTREVRQSTLRSSPYGYHIVAEFYGVSTEKLLDDGFISDSLVSALKNAKLETVDVFQHRYKPYGYSIIAILISSHAAIHTWPEHHYASVDIFLCSESEKGDIALESLEHYLEPEKVEIVRLDRGKETS